MGERAIAMLTFKYYQYTVFLHLHDTICLEVLILYHDEILKLYIYIFFLCRWLFKLSEWAHFSSYDVGIRSGSSASHILVCQAIMDHLGIVASLHC